MSDNTTVVPRLQAPTFACRRIPIVNAALQQIDVPVVSELTLDNPNDQEIGPVRLRIELDPPLSPPWEYVVQYLRPHERLTLNERNITLPLSSERLINQQEAERGIIHLTIETPEHSLRESFPLDIQPYNEWFGLRAHPESLACFVQPNHPALVPVLQTAQRALAAATNDPSLQGYQAGDLRAHRITAALWAAAQSFQIRYANPPASFEQLGQKVLLPDAVLGDRMGTCLDLTVFLASLLERAGLHPFLVVISGHAFPGVFLRESDHFSSALTDDYSEVAKAVEAGLALVFDSSALAQGVSFADACGIAQVKQLSAATFGFAIDVRQCRVARQIRPLPLRLSAYTAVAEPDLAMPPVPEIPDVVRVAPRTFIDRPASKSDRSNAERRLSRWKGKLLDLSLRNPLLNFRFDGRRSLPLICHDLAALEDALSTRAPFALQPAEMSGLRSEILMEQRTGKGAATAIAKDLLAKRTLVPDLPGALAERRVVDMFRMARTLSEETGQSGAWLALGFLEWHETALSKEPRYAPILLIPVEIQRGTVRDPYRLVQDDDEPRINSTLLKKLEAEFRLDVTGQDEVPEDDQGLDVPLVLDRFRALVERVPRCRVVEQAAVGFFSFTKHMMWLDLEARSQTLLENKVVRHLVDSEGRPFTSAVPFLAPTELDQRRAPGDDLAVVEADSSQLVAVQAAVDGNTFVLEGPPGTGKSQTITNLVAELMGRGQSVLFVAEKRAAIEVVKDRLGKVGLGPFCLDLHAHDATKAEIVQALIEPLDLPRFQPRRSLADHGREIAAEREALAETWRSLHTDGPAGLSVWQALSQLDTLPAGPLFRHDFDGPEGTGFDRETYDAFKKVIEGLAGAGRSIPHPSIHPFRHSQLAEWNPRRENDIARALERLDETRSRLDTMLGRTDAVALRLRSRCAAHAKELADYLVHSHEAPSRARDFAGAAADPVRRVRLMKTADAASRRVTTHSGLAASWQVRSLLARDLDNLHARFDRWSSAFFLLAFFALFFSRRSLVALARGPLPDNRSITRDLASARELRELDKALATHEDDLALALADGAATVGSDTPDAESVLREAAALAGRLAWCDADRQATLRQHNYLEARDIAMRASWTQDLPAPFAMELRGAVEDYTTALRTLATVLELSSETVTATTPLAEVAELVASWRSELKGVRGLRDWSAYVRAREAVRTKSLGTFVDAFESGHVAVDGLPTAFERSVLTWRIEDALTREPHLARFRGVDHEARAETFRRLDDERLRLAQEEIRLRLMGRLPDPNFELGEVGVLRAEAKKKRRHLPLRKLFAKIPTILPRLKPCVLMSPMSVAQYLDPTLSLFDVVVFDEASQIPPWDAIGALARGRRAIVVGDSKQMPPTSFFGKVEDDSSDDETEDMESILDECDRSGLPKLSLKWHYRSRHPSLIHFSNTRYYDSQLVTFPAAAAHAPTLGVRWIPVDGIYDKGGKRDNRKEAEVVVAEVVRRLRDPATADKSIGVVTFAMPQRDLIDELLETERQKHPELERFFDPKVTHEPVFIKNLENVQGDERDVIIFSMSYGPDKTGKVALNFGALNRAGGERRLNVAVTRAKDSLVVVSSLRPEHIGEGRTSAVGVRHLREFLAFAQRSGEATSAEEAAMREVDSTGFLDQLARRLKEHGFRSDKNIGAPGPRVDLAVIDPRDTTRYLLGVVTDSPVWARFPSLKDREKLGPTVLERQGWSLYRIWSLDFWHDPERVFAALLERVRARASEPVPKVTEQVSATASATPSLVPSEVAFGVEGAHISDPVPAEDLADSNAQANTTAAESPLPTPPTPAQQFASAAPRIERPRTDPLSWNERATGPWRATPYVRHPPVSLVESHPSQHPRFFVWVAEQLVRVVEIEAPIHLEDAVRRAFDAWSTPRVGKSMQQGVLQALSTLGHQHIRLDGGTFWTGERTAANWFEFRVGAADGVIRAIEQVPLEEVRNAALAVMSRALGTSEDQLIGQLMQVFGIARRGSKVAEHLSRGIELAVQTGHVIRDGDQLRFV